MGGLARPLRLARVWCHPPPPPEEKSYPSQPIGMYFLYLDLFTQTHESTNMVTPLTATP